MISLHQSRQAFLFVYSSRNQFLFSISQYIKMPHLRDLSKRVYISLSFKMYWSFSLLNFPQLSLVILSDANISGQSASIVIPSRVGLFFNEINTWRAYSFSWLVGWCRASLDVEWIDLIFVNTISSYLSFIGCTSAVFESWHAIGNIFICGCVGGEAESQCWHLKNRNRIFAEYFQFYFNNYL